MYKLFLGLLFTFIFGPHPPVSPPVITGTYCTSGTISTVNGTCVEKDGTIIDVFKNGASTGTVTLTSKSWTITGVSFSPGDKISAQASNDQGESAISDTVTVNADAGPANAGTDQNLCNTTSSTLAGNNPSPGTGMWTVIAGGATVTAPSNPTSAVTNLAAGANTFRWTISNAPCTSSSDDVTINVSALPSTANAGADQTLCNSTTGKLDGNVPLLGAGTWSMIAGGATVDNPSDGKSTVSNLAFGINTFRWTITTLTSALCTSTDDITITVRALAPAADAGPDQNLCNTTTATLVGNNPSPGTGMWTVIAGGATVTSPSNPASGITNLSAGANTFRWTISNAPCAGSTDDITINVQGAPTADAGTDQKLCNATTATLVGNNPSPGTGTWTVIAGGATVTTPSNPASGVTNLSVGANTFRWTITNPPCAPSTDDITITVSAPATVANAGADQSLCNSTVATLAGNGPAAGVGIWTKVSGSGTITTPGSPASGITGLTVGTSVFRWTIANGSCVSTDDVIITISAPATVANAGPDQTLCNASTTSLAGNAPATGTGGWTIISGSGTITNPASAASGVTGLIPGSAVFRWTITNGSCVSTDDVTITVKAPAPVASAGSDQSLCNTTTATLGGNNPSPGTGMWTVIAGGASITSPSNSASGVANLAVGANTFRWTISNAPCTATSDDITINVQGAVTADAGTDQTLCNATTATLGGNNPSPGTGMWTVIAGGASVTSPSNPASGVTNLAVGANTFRWTITNPPCAPSTDDVTVTISAPVTAVNAGPDQTLCSASATLSGNTPASGTGTWTRISGSGTITSPGNPASGITGLAPGTSVFRWTITNGACTGYDEVSIINGTTALTINAGPDQTLCNITTATLAGNAPAPGTTGAWSVISGGAIVTSPSNPNSGVSNLGTGINTFRWTITDAACVASDDVTIIISAPPTTANAGPDQVVCTSTATLAGNNALSGKGTWTVIAGGATVTAPANPLSGVTNLTQGVNTFRWTISNAPCTPSPDDVTITVSGTLTAANAGTNQTLCNTGITTLAGNTPATGTGGWTKFSGSGTITTPASPTSGVSGLTVGTSVFVWTISNPPCAPSSDTVSITVSAPPTVPDAGQNQTLCNTTSILLAGNTPTTGSGIWTKISGSGTIVTPANPGTGVTGLAPGTSVFRWTITNGACTASDDVTIDVNALPAANAGTDQTLCNAVTTTLAGNAPGTGTGVWTKISGSGNITAPGSPVSAVTGLSIGTSVFRWTISNGVCTSMDDVIIIVSSSPTAANAGPDQTLCSSNAKLAGNIPVTGTGTWTRVSGSGNITTPGNPASGVTGLTAGTSVFAWTISNGACFSSDSISIINGNVPAVNAGPDQSLCNSASTTLAGNTPLPGTTGMWSVIAGAATVMSPSNPASAVTNLSVGMTIFRWTITGGGCVATDSIIINVNVTPTTANAGPDQTSFSSIATLFGNTPVTGTGAWTVITGPAKVTTPSNPKSGVTGLSLGLNTFRWTISAPPCPGSFDEVNINVALINIPPDAKNDTVLLPEDSFLSINVQANDYDANFDSLITSIITPPANGKAILNGKKIDYYPDKNFNGKDKIVYAVCDGGTPSLCDTALVLITVIPVNDPPIVTDTSLITHQNTSATICIPVSDVDGVQVFTVSSCKDPVHGTYISTVTGNQFCVTYTPGSDYSGLDSICMVVCDNGSPSFCDTARVFIKVIGKSEVVFEIPHGFSPNGDGVNDLFVIPGIEEYPDNHIVIFNQWGNLVFEQKPYTNKWDGSCQKGLLQGNKLPVGTYYYVLDLGNGSDPFKSYVYISR